MKLVRARDPEPSVLEKHLTGQGDLANRLDEQRATGMRVAVAAFRDGGRTLWHRHDGEQVLYVLTGRGWVQQDGGEALVIERGDVVYISPGERHWHGAQAGHDLEHLVVTAGDTEWYEEVEAPASHIGSL